MIDYVICPNNPHHQISKHKCPEAMNEHITTCPNVGNVISRHLVSTPETRAEQVTHEIMNVEDFSDLGPTTEVPTFSLTKTIIVLFSAKKFQALAVSHQGKGYNLNRLAIGKMIPATSSRLSEFPGFRELDNEGRHEDHLVLSLAPYETDQVFVEFFDRFYQILINENPKSSELEAMGTRMGYSTQLSGSDDIALLIVSDKDMSGFGVAVRRHGYKIGVFSVIQSKLVGKISHLQGDQVMINQLLEQDRMLMEEVVKKRSERAKLQEAKDSEQRQLLIKQSRIEQLKTTTSEAKAQHDALFKERHEATRTHLAAQIEKNNRIIQEGKTQIQLKKDQKNTVLTNLAQLEADHKHNLEQLTNQKKAAADKLKAEELKLQGQKSVLDARKRELQHAANRISAVKDIHTQKVDPQ